MAQEYRKLISNGTTTLISIPPPFLKELKVAAGDYMMIELNEDNTITLRSIYTTGRKYAANAAKRRKPHDNGK